VGIGQQLSVSDLLDKYAANQDKLRSFIAVTKTTGTRVKQDTSGRSSNPTQDMIEFRYDDSGGNMRAYYRTESVHDKGGVSVPPDRSAVYLWNDRRFYQYSKARSVDDSDLFLSPSPEQIRDAIAILYDGAGPILGILYGDVDRFDSVLRQADSTSVRSSLETVGSEDCYVIDAKSKHGNYTLWLDPQHGYGLAKAQVYRGPEHLRFGRPRSSYEVADDVSTFALSKVRFENVEGAWVPMEIDCGFTSSYQAENLTSSVDLHYVIAQITLNPDHTQLRSFVPDIENGTRVRLEEAPGIRYIWKNGTVVADIDDSVVKEIDQTADDLRAKEQGVIGQTGEERGAMVSDQPTTPVRPSGKQEKEAAGLQKYCLLTVRLVSRLIILVAGCLTLGILAWLISRRIMR
jgi:hypothetical protein